MAENTDPIPTDSAKALNAVILKTAGSMDSLLNKIRASKDPLGDLSVLFDEVAESLKRTDDYTEKLIKNVSNVNSILGIAGNTVEDINNSFATLLTAAAENEDIQRDLQDILREELQTRTDMVLQQTMLETGLEGVYAQMAAQMILNKDSLINTSKQIAAEADLKDVLAKQLLIKEEMKFYNGILTTAQTEKLLKLEAELTMNENLVAKKEVQLKVEKDLVAAAKIAYDKQHENLIIRQKQNKVIEKQNELVRATAAATLRLKEESEAYKKSAMGHIATFQALLKQPQLIAGMAIAAAGKMGAAFSETYKSMKDEGLSSGQALTATMHSYITSIMSFGTVSAKSVQEASKAIQETGGTLHDAEEAAGGAARMVRDFGGSAADAGKAIGNLSRLPGMTKQAAENTALFGAHLAVAANVPADTVTKAIANNMDAAAMAGPKMQKSFALAAINAEKIGVEFSVITNTQKSLLNFEDSINKQMEASVLLGREINLDKARELALAGDLEGMQREILKVVGSEAEFNKMNVLQKEALAASMGVSVGDMAKMVKGQGELTELGKEGLAANAATAPWYKVAGNFIMENAGAMINFAATTAAGIVQLLTMNATRTLATTIKLADTAATVAGTTANIAGTTATIAGTTATTVNTGVVSANTVVVGAAGTTASSAAIGMLAFAAAAIATGAAVYLVFLGITSLAEAMKGMSSEALIALVAIVVAIGVGMYFMSGAITAVSAASEAGAVGMAIFALVMLSVGAAVWMIGAGFKMAAEGIVLMAKGLDSVNIQPLLKLASVLPILAVGFIAIAAGLSMMAAASVPLMPFLGALMLLTIAMPLLSNMLGSVGEAKDESKKDPIEPILTEIKTTLNKMNTYLATPWIVQMDSTKVGEALKKGLAI